MEAAWEVDAQWGWQNASIPETWMAVNVLLRWVWGPDIGEAGDRDWGRIVGDRRAGRAYDILVGEEEVALRLPWIPLRR